VFIYSISRIDGLLRFGESSYDLLSFPSLRKASILIEASYRSESNPSENTKRSFDLRKFKL